MESPIPLSKIDLIETTKDVRKFIRYGQGQPDKNTEIIAESVVYLIKKLAIDPHLRSEVLTEINTESFQAASNCLIEQNAITPLYFSRLVQEKCGPCVTRVLDEHRDLFKEIFAPQLNKDIYMTEKSSLYFRACCLSLTRGVSIDEAFDTDGPDIDGLKLWMMLGTLFCISKIIDLPDATVH